MIEKSDSEYKEKLYCASDEENYVPQADYSIEEQSDIKQETIIEHEEEYDLKESVEDEPGDILTAKDLPQWCSVPLPSTKQELVISHHI